MVGRQGNEPLNRSPMNDVIVHVALHDDDVARHLAPEARLERAPFAKNINEAQLDRLVALADHKDVLQARVEGVPNSILDVHNLERTWVLSSVRDAANVANLLLPDLTDLRSLGVAAGCHLLRTSLREMVPLLLEERISHLLLATLLATLGGLVDSVAMAQVSG